MLLEVSEREGEGGRTGEGEGGRMGEGEGRREGGIEGVKKKENLCPNTHL